MDKIYGTTNIKITKRSTNKNFYLTPYFQVRSLKTNFNGKKTHVKKHIQIKKYSQKWFTDFNLITFLLET